MTAIRVLLVDDDRALAEMLGKYLSGYGLTVTSAKDGEEALERLRRTGFDAVILDLMLPGIDGFALLPRLREVLDVPVLMLTARGEDEDRIVGLELGADDYLTKPFNPRELLARLRALVRRGTAARAAPGALLRFGRLTIDPARRVVALDGEERELTAHQFDLLLALARSPGRVMTRDELLRRARGVGLSAFDRSIDVHISRIRAAVEDDPKTPRRILTIRGVGYVFTSEERREPSE